MFDWTYISQINNEGIPLPEKIKNTSFNDNKFLERVNQLLDSKLQEKIVIIETMKSDCNSPTSDSHGMSYNGGVNWHYYYIFMMTNMGKLITSYHTAHEGWGVSAGSNMNHPNDLINNIKICTNRIYDKLLSSDIIKFVQNLFGIIKEKVSGIKLVQGSSNIQIFNSCGFLNIEEINNNIIKTINLIFDGFEKTLKLCAETVESYNVKDKEILKSIDSQKELIKKYINDFECNKKRFAEEIDNFTKEKQELEITKINLAKKEMDHRLNMIKNEEMLSQIEQQKMSLEIDNYKLLQAKLLFDENTVRTTKELNDKKSSIEKLIVYHKELEKKVQTVHTQNEFESDKIKSDKLFIQRETERLKKEKEQIIMEKEEIKKMNLALNIQKKKLKDDELQFKKYVKETCDMNIDDLLRKKDVSGSNVP